MWDAAIAYLKRNAYPEMDILKKNPTNQQAKHPLLKVSKWMTK